MKTHPMFFALALLVTLSTPAQGEEPPVFLLKWGSFGGTVGQFNVPTGLGLDPDGNVYAADRNNNRVQEFGPDGHFIRAFGTPGQFSAPHDVAVSPNGDIYVADYGNVRVQVLDASGAPLRSFTTSWYPVSIAIDPLGPYVYVLLSNGNISKHNSVGDSLLLWNATSGGTGPRGFAVSASGSIYVSTGGGCTVKKFSSTGLLEDQWGPAQGHDPGQCSSFSALSLDSNENVYLTGTDGRVQIFQPDGTFLTQWGSLGSGDGQFAASVPDIVIDSQRHIYILDTDNSRVQKCGDIATDARRSSWGRIKLLYR